MSDVTGTLVFALDIAVIGVEPEDRDFVADITS